MVMDAQSIKLIVDKLELLAQKVGMTTEQMWPFFIKQQYIDFFVWAVITGVFLISTAILFRYAVKHWDPRHERGSNRSWSEEGGVEKPPYFYSIVDSDYEVGWLWGVGIMIALTLVFFVMACVYVMDVFNPEYAALQDMIYMLK